jgi:hypothetical protein
MYIQVLILLISSTYPEISFTLSCWIFYPDLAGTACPCVQRLHRFTGATVFIYPHIRCEPGDRARQPGDGAPLYHSDTFLGGCGMGSCAALMGEAAAAAATRCCGAQPQSRANRSGQSSNDNIHHVLPPMAAGAARQGGGVTRATEE